MWRYIVKRLLWLILVLLCAAVLIFAIMWFVPGDPAEMMLDGVGTQEDIARLREQLGLTDPFFVQLGRFLYNSFLKFDFGTSYIYKTPVVDELMLRLPRTLKLGIISIALSALIGIPLGVNAALHRNGFQDQGLLVISMIFVSVPQFWLALEMMLLFAVKLHWLPISGIGTWQHWVMPVIANTVGSIAMNARQARSAVLETSRADFVTTARAKGVHEQSVVWKHMIPNAMIPVINALGNSFTAIITSSIVRKANIMKKLLALFLALTLVLSLAACGGAKSTEAPTETPTTEAPPTEEAAVPLFFSYSEDRGDFKIEWSLLLNPDGTYIMSEVHGLSGETTNHTGKSWTDNGDGTITTGPWDVTADVSEFMEKDGSCTWIIDGVTATPVNAGAGSDEGSETSVNPGQYTFADGETTWLVKIMGNGSCVIVETDTASGEELKEHTVKLNEDGLGWIDNGNGTFETNEWEPEEREDNKPRMSSPNGVVTWKVVDAENCLVEPTEAAAEESAIAYGAYHYTDAEGNLWAIMIMGNGDCVIQPNDAEGNVLMSEDGGPVEYKTNGFRVNDDGTFTSFPLQDPTNIPEFLAGGEDGMATWRIIDAENMIVEKVEE